MEHFHESIAKTSAAGKTVKEALFGKKYVFMNDLVFLWLDCGKNLEFVKLSLCARVKSESIALQLTVREDWAKRETSCIEIWKLIIPVLATSTIMHYHITHPPYHTTTNIKQSI